MSYSFEEYDAFLASFNNPQPQPHNKSISQVLSNGAFFNNGNSNGNRMTQAQLQQFQKQQMLSNPSLSTSLSTDDDDLAFNSFYDFNENNELNENTNSGQFLLSPDYTSNSSNSPIDFNNLQANEINGDQFNDFSFQQQQQGSFNVNNNVAYIKKESISSESNNSSHMGSPTSTLTNNNTHRVKLSDIKGHSQASISKKPCKKEKSSHNMIEKRYRTNINDKIKALRDSVPALRVLVDSGDDEFDDQLDGLQPAKKLNKATILSKATEYIKHLESKNESLRKEIEEMRNKMYDSQGNNVTPTTSVSSYSSNMSNGSQTADKSYTNKILLGGLGCMVGAGLNDDFNNVDAKSLFSLPVFSFGQSGFQVLSKPVIMLMKMLLIFGVVLSIVFPSLFYSKSSKKKAPAVESTLRSIEDVRNLKSSNIWATFQLKKGHSNNDYVKSAIFRAVLLKVQNYHSNSIVKFLTNAYVDKLWSYIKEVKLNSELNDYDYIRTILSLDNSDTINNEDNIKRFINYDLESLNDDADEQQIHADFSIITIFYKLINETTTNSILTGFMASAVSSSAPVPEISKKLVPEIDDFNVELKTLFSPTDSQIAKYKQTLESWGVTNIKTDDLLVLYSAIIQNLAFDKKDSEQVKKWFKKLDVQSINDLGFLGFTALYTIITTMIQSNDTYLDDKEIIFKIEEISGVLRIWLGDSNGSVLHFNQRSQLIDYFVNVSLKINGLHLVDEDLTRFVANKLIAAN